MVVGGVVPVRASTLQTHAPIVIVGDGNFTVTNGVIGGNGTASNPYRIEGWDIAKLTMSNTNAYVVIRNVYISSGVVANFERVVDFVSVSNVRMENVTITDNIGEDGVYLTVLSVRLSSNIVISGSNIVSNPRTDTVDVRGSTNVTISGNVISNSSGIFVGGCGKVRVIGNIITDGSGIIAEFSTDITTAGNIVASSRDHAIVYHGASGTITGNDIESSAYGGITVIGNSPGSVVIADNRVDNNGWGLFGVNGMYGYGIRAPDGVLIFGNIISNNPIGLQAGDPSSRVYHNNFLDNLVQVTSDIPNYECCEPFLLDNGYPSAGNFWSDYHGVDTCSGLNQNVCLASDGIGDTPVVIAPTTIDHYPLMKPFAPTVSGTIRFQPASIASQSAGRYFLALVGLPQGYSRSNLVLSSIRLNGTITALSVAPLNQPNGASVLVVTFNMTQVKSLLPRPGNYVLNFTGNLLTSTNFRPFQAAATVRFLSS